MLPSATVGLRYSRLVYACYPELLRFSSYLCRAFLQLYYLLIFMLPIATDLCYSYQAFCILGRLLCATRVAAARNLPYIYSSNHCFWIYVQFKLLLLRIHTRHYHHYYWVIFCFLHFILSDYQYLLLYVPLSISGCCTNCMAAYLLGLLLYFNMLFYHIVSYGLGDLSLEKLSWGEPPHNLMGHWPTCIFLYVWWLSWVAAVLRDFLHCF